MKLSPPHNTKSPEDRMAASTEAGREALRVRSAVYRAMTFQQKLEKAFRLTEEIQEVMRSGIRLRNPLATEEEIQRIYVDRMLAIHGTSLKEIRNQQLKEQSQ